MDPHRISSRWRLTITAATLAVAAAACGPSGPATPSADESRLADGVRLDMQGNCEPHRDDLPAATLAAIQCSTSEEDVGVRLYLFNRQEDLMAAYWAMLEEHGIEARMDEGSGGRIEGAYVPGDEPGGALTSTREARYVDGSGHGRYFTTLPPFVLATAETVYGDGDFIHEWAWRGNQDTPGAPTIWRDGTPVNPFDGGKG